jgi:mannose-6-phosphate isomerase-like protein (cupin superfamily)
MSARSHIVLNPVAGEQRRQVSRRLARVTVHGAGRGRREPQVEPRGEQRLTVVDGRMAVAVNGRLTILEAGDSITIAPGVEHAWWSTRAGALCVEIEADPEVFGLPTEAERFRGRRTRVAPGWRGVTVRIAS